MRHAIDYDLAFEEWEENHARARYDSDLSDGLITAERYTIDGVGVNHQPFEEWLQGNDADRYFEEWIEAQYESAMDAKAEALRDERMGL